jgi:hypothetical protein
MQRLFLFIFFLLPLGMTPYGFAQGINNDFEFDQEDFNYVFKKLGYGVFKFPVRQSKSELFDFVLEEYRDRQLVKRHTVIETAQEAFKVVEVDVKDYMRPKLAEGVTDSVFLHRIYSERKDSTLTLFVKTHGVSSPIEFSVHDLSVGDIRARFEVKEELDAQGFLSVEDSKWLLFFYANKDPNEPLWCPAGLSKEQIVKQFYFAVFVSIEKLE